MRLLKETSNMKTNGERYLTGKITLTKLVGRVRKTLLFFFFFCCTLTFYRASSKMAMVWLHFLRGITSTPQLFLKLLVLGGLSEAVLAG